LRLAEPPVPSQPEAPKDYADTIVSATPSELRLRALLDAGIALASELSLDHLLQRLTEVAAELTAARYVALGVIDPTGAHLERFITHGLDEDSRHAIGDPPHGRGILGALITDARPLRLENLAEDPRSVGFPPNHPPMKSFLGVPVMLRGVAYGNLYLTEKEAGEEFTAGDQELVEQLASQAAVAIENARLYEAATRWSRQLESLIEVSSTLARETDVNRVLELVAERLRELLEARLVTVALPGGIDELRLATAAGDGAEELTGRVLGRSTSKTGRVLERGRSERVDSLLDDREVNVEFTRGLQARTGLWVPLIVHDRPIGVITAYDKLGLTGARFTEDDVRLAETFAARAAVAVELSERVQRDALRRSVAAQELERQRLARELHDETGQALTSILLGLKRLEGADEDSVTALRELVVDTLRDVRRLAVELRPKVLDDFGLVPALERLTDGFSEQTGIAVDLEAATIKERMPEEVETAIYRIVQEALTNVVKHAHANRVSVLVTRADGRIKVVIEDDGSGFDSGRADGDGIGLIGMRERIELLDGTLIVESSERSGTAIAVEVPV
jgi:signal transduction histidine kinase